MQAMTCVRVPTEETGELLSGRGVGSIRRHGARWLLRRVQEAAGALDPEALAKIVQRHPDGVWRLYDDIFCIITRSNDPESLMPQLLRLDPNGDDLWMARIHVRFLKSLPTTGSRCVQTVASICQHYARHRKLRDFLEINGSQENNQDPEFRPNTNNFLIVPMRRVVKENHAEDLAVNIIRTYLLYGADVDVRYKLDGGESAVHFAAYHNLWRCVELFLEQKASIDEVYINSTARQIIKNRMMEQLLVKHGYPELPSTDKNDVTAAMFNALYEGNEERFQNIYIATLTQQGKYSDDDWNLICKLAPIEYVSQFVSEHNHVVESNGTRAGSLTFSQDDGWNTMLQLACMKNLPNVVRTLLEIDSDPDRVSALKDPPILLAAENGCFDIVLQLVSHKVEDEATQHAFHTVDVGVTGDFGDTLVHKLARAWQTATSRAEEDSTNTAKQQDDPDKAQAAIETVEKIFNQLYRRHELDINAVNEKAETALTIAMTSCNKLLFRLLLKKGAFLGASKQILHEMREDDLAEALNSTLSTELYKGQKFVNIDFECFYLQYDIPNIPDYNVYPEMLPLYRMSQSKKHKHILPHPLITSFLDLKWFKFYSIYFTNLFLYLCFVVSLTCHVSFLVMQDEARADISQIFTALSCMYMLVRELMQFFMSYREYFKTFENWMELFIVIATIYLLDQGLNNSVTFLILATYAEFSLLLGRHPKVATYIAMFLRVSKVNVLLLALSSPIIFAFATCFTVLLKSDSENPYFHNSTSSVFKTIVMITGEYEFGDIKFEVNPLLSKIVFILFVISIGIILMNLLNALAVNDTEAIQKDAEIISLQAKIELFTKIESALLGYPMYWYGNSWGRISDSILLTLLFKFRSKFRGLLNGISVLPLSENVSFLLSVREDGKIMEKVVSTNTGKHIMRDNKIFNDGPKSKLLQIVTKYILGVHMREIFEDSYYYTLYLERDSTKSRISEDVKHVQDSIDEVRVVVTDHTKNLERLTDLHMKESLSVQKLTTDMSELCKSVAEQTSAVQNFTREISELKQQVKLLTEIAKIRQRSDEQE